MTAYPRTEAIPVFLKVIDGDLKQRIIEEYYHKPKAYVEFIDENGDTYNLAPCSNFYIRNQVNDAYGTFSAAIQKAEIWNPRTLNYKDLISPDQRKRIKVYFGQEVGNETKYAQIFTGVPYDSPEKYAFGGDNSMRLRGYSVGYLLDRIDGTSEDDTFTGTSQELIEYWMGQASMEYVLAYEEYINFAADSIAYDTALTGINQIKTALGQKVILYIDRSGVFIMKALEDGISGDVEFNYTSSNLFKLELQNLSRNVITSVNVSGVDDVESTATAAQEMINKHGINLLSVSSGLIQTQAAADKVAADSLRHGARFENMAKFEIALNPYIDPNSLIKITDLSWSGIEDALVKVEAVVHRYNGGSLQKSYIEGYID